MAYKGPTLKDLYALAAELKKSYQGTNIKRLSFIALYDQLVSQTMQKTDLPENIINVLIGALIFEMADIKFFEYGGGSAKLRVGRFYNSGSHLYSLIKSKLYITSTNKFGYDERLFYLNQFYKYIDKVYPEEGCLDLHQRMKSPATWKTNKELKDNVHKAITPILKKNSDSLHYLVHGVPVLTALLKNLQKLEDEYSHSKSNYTAYNPKRLAMINFIKLIIQSYQGKEVNSMSWQVCVGAAIFALMQINNEYRVFDPTRSALYRSCLHAINANNLDDIEIDDRIKCLTLLSSHLIALQENQTEYNALLSKTLDASTIQKIDYTNFANDIKLFQAKLPEYISGLEKIKNTPSTSGYYLSSGVSYFFQYTAGPVVVQTAKNLIVGGISVGGFFAAGPIGSAIFGAAGAMLVSGISRMVGEGILWSVTANMCAWLLEKVGNTLGEVTANVVSYPFSATPKGFEELRMKLKPEDDVVFVNMVNTLLELDDASITDKEKEHIRNVLGLENDEKLVPLSSLYVKSAEELQTENELLCVGYSCKIYK